VIWYAIAVPFGLLGTLGLYTATVLLILAKGRPFLYRWHRQGWAARAPRVRQIRDVRGVYSQLCLTAPLYNGQTENAAARFIDEGNDTRALFWTHGVFIPWPDGDLDEPERFLIRVFPWCRWTGQNKTRGGS
jgi:hypothetical protein